MLQRSQFWRSVNLTGNQTPVARVVVGFQFWRSVNLTGNQTHLNEATEPRRFWRSVNLTGNQTFLSLPYLLLRFGAVSI